MHLHILGEATGLQGSITFQVGRHTWNIHVLQTYMFVKNQKLLSPLFHTTQISGCFLCGVVKYGYEITFSVLFLAVTLNNAKTSFVLPIVLQNSMQNYVKVNTHFLLSVVPASLYFLLEFWKSHVLLQSDRFNYF